METGRPVDEAHNKDATNHLKLVDGVGHEPAAASDSPTATPRPPQSEGSQDSTKQIQRLVYSCPVDHSGTTVYVRGWCNTDGSKHPIVLVHDLGEEISMYKKAAVDICKAGYNVYGFDLRGHGRSGRRLGHIPSFSVLIHDLLQVLAWVKHKEGGQPPLLIGQGVGALIAISFTRKFPKFCQSVVLSAPCLELSTKVSKPAKLLLKALSEFAPTSRLPRSLAPIFTDDSAKRTSRITANFAHEVFMALSTSDNKLLDIDGQMLILCPSNDRVCRYGALKKAALLHDKGNITIVDVEEAGHHVFTESEATRKAATEHMFEWLQRQVTKEADNEPTEKSVEETHESPDE